MTSFHSKPTDCHQYLHYKSSHPKHTKSSIIYSQTLKVYRVCSQESDFKSWFLETRYPENIIDTEMKKVLNDSNRVMNNKIKKGIPFLVKFQPMLKIFQKIIDINLYLLYVNEEVKKAFAPRPTISYRRFRIT